MCPAYIDKLSELYCAPSFDAAGEEKTLTAEEQTQVLKTLQDFSSISKAVKLSNLFLTNFATVCME